MFTHADANSHPTWKAVLRPQLQTAHPLHKGFQGRDSGLRIGFQHQAPHSYSLASLRGIGLGCCIGAGHAEVPAGSAACSIACYQQQTCFFKKPRHWLAMFLSVYLRIYLSVCLPAWLFAGLSIYLSMFWFVQSQRCSFVPADQDLGFFCGPLTRVFSASLPQEVLSTQQ